MTQSNPIQRYSKFEAGLSTSPTSSPAGSGRPHSSLTITSTPRQPSSEQQEALQIRAMAAQQISPTPKTPKTPLMPFAYAEWDFGGELSIRNVFNKDNIAATQAKFESVLASPMAPKKWKDKTPVTAASRRVLPSEQSDLQKLHGPELYRKLFRGCGLHDAEMMPKILSRLSKIAPMVYPTHTALHKNLLGILREIKVRGDAARWADDSNLRADALEVEAVLAHIIYGASGEGYLSIAKSLVQLLKETGLAWILLSTEAQRIPPCWEAWALKRRQAIPGLQQLRLKELTPSRGGSGSFSVDSPTPGRQGDHDDDVFVDHDDSHSHQAIDNNAHQTLKYTPPSALRPLFGDGPFSAARTDAFDPPFDKEPRSSATVSGQDTPTDDSHPRSPPFNGENNMNCMGADSLEDVRGMLETNKAMITSLQKCLEKQTQAQSELCAKHVQQISEILDTHTSRIRALQDTHAKQIQEIQAAHSSLVREIQAVHGSQIQEIQATHAAQIQETQASQASQVQKMQATIEANESAMRDMRGSQDTALKTAVEQLEAKMQSKFDQAQQHFQSLYNNITQPTQVHYFTASPPQQQQQQYATGMPPIQQYYSSMPAMQHYPVNMVQPRPAPVQPVNYDEWKQKQAQEQQQQQVSLGKRAIEPEVYDVPDKRRKLDNVSEC
ncbi:uncharacterized protein B0I36DRAFT_406043 [Microdochium trichocladiopsis]|uniref:Uncharacterized protein n=1 Tax=Microdochium trichocladiopsis TaxID=1682393 RepID=A0A9P9BWX8_9PEZI|nr:uncharacterized protein B0I36DRAFT_406043 [Microdochium trichocladiopsis]KAH7035536.1 hypothetical protein B0I36DRAFT_406043 [Microdochium trichocladiopsis]